MVTVSVGWDSEGNDLTKTYFKTQTISAFTRDTEVTHEFHKMRLRRAGVVMAAVVLVLSIGAIITFIWF